VLEALAAEEAAAERGGGRSKLASGLFGHRKPVAPPAAPPPRGVDAAVRADALRRLTAAMKGADSVAAAAAEGAAFAKCRANEGIYARAITAAIMDAQRATQLSAPVKAFVPPRRVEAAASAAPAPLKSTRIGGEAAWWLPGEKRSKLG